MRVNSTMKKYITPSLMKRVLHGGELERHLRDLLDEGIVVRNKAVFLRALYEHRGNARVSKFSDLTGYECFVNHFHLPAFMNGPARWQLEQSLLFSIELSRKLQALPIEHSAAKDLLGAYTMIVSLNDNECTFRC